MGTDIFVFKKCRHCKTVNQFELYRSDHFPFDIKNEKHWNLLKPVFARDIANAMSRYTALTFDEQSEYENVRDYIAQELKFSDDGAVNFCHCEKCGEPLMFYVVSA
jgi:hypothetical protein